jgi:hypothetical protein
VSAAKHFSGNYDTQQYAYNGEISNVSLMHSERPLVVSVRHSCLVDLFVVPPAAVSLLYVIFCVGNLTEGKSLKSPLAYQK